MIYTQNGPDQHPGARSIVRTDNIHIYIHAHRTGQTSTRARDR